MGSGWGRCFWGRMPGPWHTAGLRSLATVPFFQEGRGGLWEAAMGVIYRGHRKSPKSQNLTQRLDHRVCQLLPDWYSTPTWLPAGGGGGVEMGRTPAWRSQSYRVRAGKREGWGPRGTQREQELCLAHLGGLPGGEISRAGPWGKKNLQARKRHSSLRAQHKSH